MFYNVWAWIPLAWSFSGCLTGALIYWLFIEVLNHLETQKKSKNTKSENEFEIPYTIDHDDQEIQNLTVILDEKLRKEKHPAPPAMPNFDKSPPQQLKPYLDDTEASPAVPVDRMNLGNGVTVTDRHFSFLEGSFAPDS